MAKSIDPQTVKKKLMAVVNTQDSISMLGVWVICNKHEHKLICDRWLDVIKSADSAKRLTLLYVCNEVIQKCSRKNALAYKTSFEDVIPEAITYLRKDISIRKSVERVLNIWRKRKIYDSEFLDQLLATLLSNRTPDKLKTKILAEYKTNNLFVNISAVKASEELLLSKKAIVDKFKLCNQQIHNLKDKTAGKKFLKDFDEQRREVKSYFDLCKSHLKAKKSLIENLEQALLYYKALFQDATKVAKVYKNYENRLLQTDEVLKKRIQKLSEENWSFINQIPDKTQTVDDMDISDEEQSHDNSEIMTNLIQPIINKPYLQTPQLTDINTSTNNQPTANRSDHDLFQSMNIFKDSIIPSPGLDRNASSPPRLQSLDSRLADIFSKGSSASPSSPSRDKLENASNDSPREKNPTDGGDLLPGLGDLEDSYKSTENIGSSWSRGSSIPVIGGGCNSLIKSEVANDATPTLDEPFLTSFPLQTDNKLTNRNDTAFNFLSNIMEQVKPKQQTKPAALWNDPQHPPLPSPFEAITNQSAATGLQWNEKSESMAWLAAYSPPPHNSPNSNWRLESSNSPPLPPPDKIKVSESIKPPIPPGPEPSVTSSVIRSRRRDNEPISEQLANQFTTNLITLSNQPDSRHFNKTHDRDLRISADKQQPENPTFLTNRETLFYKKKFSNVDDYPRHNYYDNRPSKMVPNPAEYKPTDRVMVNRRPPPPRLFNSTDLEPKRFRHNNDFRPRSQSRFPPHVINPTPNFGFERFPRFNSRKRFFPVEHRGSYHKMRD